MGFSFNWAGVNVPHAQVEGNAAVQNRSRNDGAAWGNAARGYVNNRAMKEYADMIDNAQQQDDPRIAAIEAEIQKLEARNGELMRAQQASQQQAQEYANYQPVQASPTYQAQQQMAGYGAFQQGMQNQGAQAANMLPMYMAQQYRTR